jgi:hypothetical protein
MISSLASKFNPLSEFAGNFWTQKGHFEMSSPLSSSRIKLVKYGYRMSPFDFMSLSLPMGSSSIIDSSSLIALPGLLSSIALVLSLSSPSLELELKKSKKYINIKKTS